MSKDQYRVSQITKTQAESILKDHHYLSRESLGFRSGVNYGLFKIGADESTPLFNTDLLCGVAIYTGISVVETIIGMCSETNQKGFYELSRLCLLPSIQSEEHNITSWFLSRSLRKLKKDYYVRAILSYADSRYHKGIIYRACNFKYYGFTPPKKDFYYTDKKGVYRRLQRGSVKGLKGEWVDRPQKHRYLIQCDKSLNIKWSTNDHSYRA